MCGRSRAPVDVEGYAQLGKGILDDGMIAVYDILRGDTLFFGLDGDGHSMLVAAADGDGGHRYRPARRRRPNARYAPDRWHTAEPK